MHRALAVILVSAVAGASGCGGSSNHNPTTPSPGPGAAPVAMLTLAVDALGSQEAIAGASDVSVDAGASTGSGLRYQVEFGDGSTATDKTSRHVYAAAGTYAIRLTVTDDAGRTASATRELTVASALGRWVGAAYVERAGQVVVRTIVLTAQDGLTVRGMVNGPRDRDRPVTGTLTAARRLTLVVDGAETFEGVMPSVVSSDGSAWDAAVQGGAASGETLPFKRRLGEPSGPSPDAVLQMRFFSFGAPFAVKQISPARFDGSNSRGEGLAYFMEYGDGQVTTDPTTVHPLEKAGSYTARLTVVDRFGRSEVETRDYEARSLVAAGYYYWWEARGSACGIVGTLAHLTIVSQEGTTITGELVDHAESNGEPYSGIATSDGHVHLRLDRMSRTLDGTLSLERERNVMALTWAGGPCDGKTIELHFRDGY
jgi:PKD repeat protein